MIRHHIACGGGWSADLEHWMTLPFSVIRSARSALLSRLTVEFWKGCLPMQLTSRSRNVEEVQELPEHTGTRSKKLRYTGTVLLFLLPSAILYCIFTVFPVIQ